MKKSLYPWPKTFLGKDPNRLIAEVISRNKTGGISAKDWEPIILDRIKSELDLLKP